MTYQVASVVEDADLIVRRRKQIVDAATELFSINGFYKTTIKEIAKLANVSPGLVYQYVTDKDDVLLLVLQEVVDAYARQLPLAIEGIESPLHRLVAAISAYCRIVDERRAATVLAYRSTKSLPRHKREIIQSGETATNQIIADLITECVQAGFLRPVNVDLFSYQIVMNAHAWALKSWHLKTICSLDEYIESSVDILLRGVVTKRGETELKDR